MASIFSTESDEFANTKSWADQLLRDKLAIYMDTEHTILQLTNFGKYWMVKGGYESFLKEGHSTKSHYKDDDDPKDQLSSPITAL